MYKSIRELSMCNDAESFIKALAPNIPDGIKLGCEKIGDMLFRMSHNDKSFEIRTDQSCHGVHLAFVIRMRSKLGLTPKEFV